ncbi:hypothetical protein [Raineyella fluvialis]|uniref:Uncharacterized protein n=1 Tax=Raineyella fluvialis TaxID=2662261 RepID=A0A5Q2FHC4_9ACTN|nr:hypothetical protein [Raineyella fluvialis]QGF24523.1 hypothetical protein Rai3103_13655 [Raineyella fluvialis]
MWFVIGAAASAVVVLVGRRVIAASQDTPALERVNAFITDVRRASAEREAEIRDALNLPEEGDE